MNLKCIRLWLKKKKKKNPHLYVVGGICVLNPRTSLHQKNKSVPLTCEVGASCRVSGVPSPSQNELGHGTCLAVVSGSGTCHRPWAFWCITCYLLPSSSPRWPPPLQAWAPEWTDGTDTNPMRSLQPKVEPPQLTCKPRGENNGSLLSSTAFWRDFQWSVIVKRANEHICGSKNNHKTQGWFQIGKIFIIPKQTKGWFS